MRSPITSLFAVEHTDAEEELHQWEPGLEHMQNNSSHRGEDLGQWWVTR